MGGARFWIGMVRRQTDGGGRQALGAASPLLIPSPEPCAISPRSRLLSNPPIHGRWIMGGGEEDHTYTQSLAPKGMRVEEASG